MVLVLVLVVLVVLVEVVVGHQGGWVALVQVVQVQRRTWNTSHKVILLRRATRLKNLERTRRHWRIWRECWTELVVIGC